jgi:hypothetical protein
MVQLIAADIETSPSISAVAVLEECFRHSPYWSLRRLDCICQQNRVIVRGVVPSYYLRQVAESLATNLVGVARVVSEIRVESD